MVCEERDKEKGGAVYDVRGTGGGDGKNQGHQIRFKEPRRLFLMFLLHSKAYSTATQHASLACASRPCCRRSCRVGKQASHAGHGCTSSEMTLALPCDACERDRLEVCDIFLFNQKQSAKERVRGKLDRLLNQYRCLIFV